MHWNPILFSRLTSKHVRILENKQIELEHKDFKFLTKEDLALVLNHGSDDQLMDNSFAPCLFSDRNVGTNEKM